MVKARARWCKMTLRWWLVLSLSIGAVIYFGSDYVIAYTDDAYVRSDFVPIAPEVDGVIQSVAVNDNQLVKAGDLLVQLDPEFYRLTLDLKQDRVALSTSDVEEKIAVAATVVSRIESASTALNFAQQGYDRTKPVVPDHVESQQKLDSATEELQHARDRLAGARNEASGTTGRHGEERRRNSQSRASTCSLCALPH
jgi:membrane fusion protein, multidrug efflux system